MGAGREVYGPDGRRWNVVRQPIGESAMTRLLRSEGWEVVAVTEDEPNDRRTWHADSRATANALLEQVAMSLRTGTEGPNQP